MIINDKYQEINDDVPQIKKVINMNQAACFRADIHVEPGAGRVRESAGQDGSCAESVRSR